MDAFVAKLSPGRSRLIWCTYLGGSNYDVAYGIGVDNAGNVYVAGRTSSTDFPTTPGAFDRTYNGGKNIPPYFGGDIFVAKISRDGGRLIYSTYVGGSSDDWARNMTVDPATGNVYLAGPTGSDDMPVTAGAFDRTYGGSVDAYVAKLSTDGSRLVYATYLGGSNDDYAEGIAVDNLGFAYVTGFTASSDFPITAGSFQQTLAGAIDVWIVKMSPDGSRLVYSTLIGGSGNDGPENASIVLDSEGSAYITGYTMSPDFPTTASGYQRRLRGSIDSFIAKLAPDGRSLVFSTYLGGSTGPSSDCWETAFGAPGIDSAGNVYVAGGTACTDFPVTPDAYQKNVSGPVDAFLVKFSPDGSKLLYATYFGGTKEEIARGVVLDGSGGIHVVGQTGSPDFPTTAGVHQPRFGTNGDTFLTKFR